jgi:hypothetical protein
MSSKTICYGLRDHLPYSECLAYRNVPHSIAYADKLIPCMNLITPTRSRIQIHHVSALMFLKLHGPPLVQWNPEQCDPLSRRSSFVERVGPKCSVVVTHVFNEKSDTWKYYTNTKTTNWTWNPITAYLVNTTQRQEQSPMKYTVKPRLPKYCFQSETTTITWLIENRLRQPSLCNTPTQPQSQ